MQRPLSMVLKEPGMWMRVGSVPDQHEKPVQRSSRKCGCLCSRKHKEARVAGMERVSGKAVR